MSRLSEIIVWAALAVSPLAAQQAPAPAPPASEARAQGVRPNYVLGPDDQIVIRAFEVDEISNKPFRIDSEGDINLPVLGKVHAGGQTVEQLEADLLERLKVLVKNPQVSVSVVGFRSEPVFVEGAFKSPGIYLLQGRTTLREVLSRAGGVLPNASRRITVSRRLEMGPIPLSNAVVDQVKKQSTVGISIASLRDNVNPVEDIVLQPLDTISVDRAEQVYVNGEVNHAGGVELGERDSMPVTQLIALVGGLGKDAASEKARVLRQVLNTSTRAEIPINLKKILEGKEIDFPLLPNDVLYVPRNSHKAALSSAWLVAVPMATSLIYVLVTRL